jgi:hypothetical protein
VVLLAGGGAGFGGWYYFTHSYTARPDLLWQKVERKKLQVTISERGSLESAENNELVCKVKAKAQGAAATNIRWVIDNGTTVRKGDKVIELDDSALQDSRITQQIAMETAKGAWEKAEQQLLIDNSTSAALIKTQEVALKVAKITLEEYLKGLYEQARVDLENKLTLARSDLIMWQERSAWSERMSRPGRQYVTAAQSEADEARRLSAELTLRNLEVQYDVLNKLTRTKNEFDLQGKVDVAVRNLATEQLKGEGLRIQDEVAIRTAKLTYEKELAKLRDLEEEIENCTLYAPRAGMVVYWIEERSRWGGGKQRIVAQGEPVDEGQKLMTIPNLEKMVVNSRVHEAQQHLVHADVKNETGFSSMVEFGLYLQPDPLVALSTAAVFRTDLRTPFQTKYRKEEHKLIGHGQEAKVRVAVFPNRQLHGHVTYISTVASVNDLFANDVKVYQTYVALDESLEGLKPGMDARVTIEVDSTSEPVLQVPLQAILGGVEMGQRRKCFVKTEDGALLRDITLGHSNETMVEVVDGLEEGDEVVMNPIVLLSEKERMEYGNLPARSGRSGQEKGGPGGFGGKGKGGEKGAPGGGMQGGGMQGAPKQGGGMQGAPKQGGGMQGGGMRGGGMQGGGMRQGKKNGGGADGAATAGGG